MEHYVILNHKNSFDALLSTPVDGIILPFKGHAHRTETALELDEIKRFLTRGNDNVKRFVLMNRLYHESDLNSLKEALDALEELPIDGIFFADLAVAEMLEGKALKEKLIYHAETYATSEIDTMFWKDENIHSLVLARELTLSDISLIGKRKKMPVGIVGHGYLNMFHSKRHLIKTFFEHTKDQEAKKVSKKRLKIIEEIRDESYPIFQDAYGTHVFRHKPLASFNHYRELEKACDFMIIDTMFMKEDEVLRVVKDYRAITKDVVDFYKNTHDDGFYFKKTVYLQEEEKA